MVIKLLKVVEICSRVEGHGNINIYLNNQNEEISQVNFEIKAYRGFENILIGKRLMDIKIIGLKTIAQTGNKFNIWSGNFLQLSFLRSGTNNLQRLI